MRRLAGATALLACAILAGCGAPERLSEREGTALLDAREVIDGTIDNAETLRTSPEEARRIRREVQKIVSRGAFETAPLDEFGLAALGELREIVPGLAETDAQGVVESLDRPATRAFLRYATSDAKRALRKPANDEVFAIEEVIRKAEPGPDSCARSANVSSTACRASVGSGAGGGSDARPAHPTPVRRCRSSPAR